MISKNQTSTHLYIYLAAALCLLHNITMSSAQRAPIRELRYREKNLLMIMGSTRKISVDILLDKDAIPPKGADRIAIEFEAQTLSPHFNALSIDPSTSETIIDKSSLEKSKYSFSTIITLYADYIGHARVYPTKVKFSDKSNGRLQAIILDRGTNYLDVKLVQDEGLWGIVFVVLVVILMILTYINVGAQLDEDNMRQLIEKPLALTHGYVISLVLMPLFSWFIGKWIFHDQILYRLGAFVFACSPAASASTLWTVMLDSDKELSVGLQIVSNFGAILSMPILLYIMEMSIETNSEYHVTRIPYNRMIGVLASLLISLLIGWFLVGRNERLKRISQKIFKPLVVSVLIFIVVFSSILYWHIYRMFNLRILAASLLINFLTFITSALLGYLTSFSADKAMAISLASAYKHSGLTFAVLLAALGAPDTYIAYVPCLAQIIIISLSMYCMYGLLSIAKCLRKSNRPDDLEASADEAKAENRRRNSSRDAGTTDPDNDEFIAMNVTDIEPEVNVINNSKQTNRLSET